MQSLHNHKNLQLSLSVKFHAISRARSLVITVENKGAQVSYLHGRSLVHNILICHDLLRHYNWKTTPRCMIKIDLRKAYDMDIWEEAMEDDYR
ncbi:hypothetical protein KY285_036924 [Solanum tuberosum]|nr:hypothetical protein KY285_036924 [Solanum tuberosum]